MRTPVSCSRTSLPANDQLLACHRTWPGQVRAAAVADVSVTRARSSVSRAGDDGSGHVGSCSRRSARSRSRASVGGRGGWAANRVAAVMMAHGSRAGTLLARGGRCDAIVVCLAADGDDILTSGPGGLHPCDQPGPSPAVRRHRRTLRGQPGASARASPANLIHGCAAPHEPPSPPVFGASPNTAQDAHVRFGADSERRLTPAGSAAVDVSGVLAFVLARAESLLRPGNWLSCAATWLQPFAYLCHNRGPGV